VYVDEAVVVRRVAQHRVRWLGSPRRHVVDLHRATVTGWTGADRDGGRTARLAAMTKWEYLTAPVLVHATKQILDNFGQDGWELVQVVPGMNPENLVAYFKRPVQ
jgi:hypothetical protein